jgi:hypothetical protein
MSIGKLTKDPRGLALLAGGAALLVFVVYYVGKKTLTAAASTAGGIVSGNNALTQGTPYQGAGIAGTLGAATNVASGGVLGNFGSWLGDKLADWFPPGGGYNPNAPAPVDTNTLNTGQAILSNPVQPQPAIVPYSRKQNVVDTPALLGTDSLLTPPAGGGSAGGYAESGYPGTGAGPLAPDYLTNPDINTGGYYTLQ